MATYQVETENGVYEVETEERQPMFATEEEGRKATAKAIGREAALKKDADSPIGISFGNIPGQLLSGVNRAINTASLNIPENILNRFGASGYVQNEDPIIRGLGEGVGFTAPTGAPMRAISALNLIKNPLFRNIAQGAGAMATQIPTQERGIEEYGAGVLGGGVFGVAGRGVEKVTDNFLKPIGEKTGDLLRKKASVYRNILNPGKDIIQKIEVKSGKKIDDFMKIAADENLVINQTPEGKLDTKSAVTALKDRKAELNAQLESALESDTDKKFNLVEIGEMAKANLSKHTRNASELKSAIKSIDDQISDEVALHGEMVDGITANRIKGGMWDVSYSPLEPNKNKVSRQIGFAIKDAIEKAYPDQAIKETNARLGDFVTLESILKKSDGNVVQRGRVGNYVGNIVGMGIGGSVGSAISPGLGTAVGSAAGAAAGGAISKFLANPTRITRSLPKDVNILQKFGSKIGSMPQKQSADLQGMSSTLTELKSKVKSEKIKSVLEELINKTQLQKDIDGIKFNASQNSPHSTPLNPGGSQGFLGNIGQGNTGAGTGSGTSSKRNLGKTSNVKKTKRK